MHHLRTCDFCGADAVGAFEVVPPELDPGEAEQRRVVLCDDCRSRLGELLEPLLDRLRGDESEAAAGGDRGDEGGGPDESPTARATTSASSAGRATTDATDRGTGSAGDTATDADADDRSSTGESADADVSGSSPSTARPDGAADTGADSGADAGADADGVEGVLLEPGTDDGPGAVDEPDGITAGDGADADGSDGDDPDDSPATDADAAGSASGTGGRRPRAYAKVVRLLRNREFPMERGAVEALAAGAYDLDEFEAVKAIDRAIEEGELVEDGDQLRRP